jgi:glutamate dehydrogenase/leucine dehydrogenase
MLIDRKRGCGKCGVSCNPKELSSGELERITRRFTWEISSFIGPERDIPAQDVYTNSQVMAVNMRIAALILMGSGGWPKP